MSATNAGQPTAGWYADPQQPGQQRYWDGNVWTEHRAPVVASEPPRSAMDTAAGPIKKRRGKGFLIALAVAVGVVILSGIISAIASPAKNTTSDPSGPAPATAAPLANAPSPSSTSQPTATALSKAEAAKRAEAAKKAEAASKAEAAKRAEAAKKAEAARKAEAAITAAQRNAIGAAKDYLSFTAFSRTGLIKQLSSKYGDGYAVKDATFAVDSLNINYNEQATKSAKNYLELTHFSHSGLVEQLSSKYGDGYTHAQAEYGVSHAGL